MQESAHGLWSSSDITPSPELSSHVKSRRTHVGRVETSTLRISVPKSPRVTPREDVDEIMVNSDSKLLHLLRTRGFVNAHVDPFGNKCLLEPTEISEKRGRKCIREVSNVKDNRLGDGDTNREAFCRELTSGEALRRQQKGHEASFLDHTIKNASGSCILSGVIAQSEEEEECWASERDEAFSSYPTTPLTAGGNLLEMLSEPAAERLKSVLRDAVQIRGFPLTWLLFILLLLGVVILFLSIGRAQFLEKKISLGSEKVAKISAAMTINQLELLHQSITKTLLLYQKTDSSSFSLYSSNIIKNICTSIQGAPILFASYNYSKRNFKRHVLCSRNESLKNLAPSFLHDLVDRANGSLRMAIYRSKYIITTMVQGFENDILVAILQKEPIGRLLLVNSIPSYSPLTMEKYYVSLLLPKYNSLKVGVALHSLNEEYTMYGVDQPTLLSLQISKTYYQFCSTESPYSWHSVLRPPYRYIQANTWNSNSTNFLMHHSLSLGKVLNRNSQILICGFFCTDPISSKCSSENPTNMWFVVGNSNNIGDIADVLSAFTVTLTIISIIFFCMLVLVYVSIGVPICHIRLFILGAFGSKKKISKLQRLLSQYSQGWWIADLQALLRILQLLAVFFRLHQKYVPQHILDQHVLNVCSRKGYVWRTVLPDQFNYGSHVLVQDDFVLNDLASTATFVSNNSMLEKAPAVGKPTFLESSLLHSACVSRHESTASIRHAPEGEVAHVSITSGIVHNIDMFGSNMRIVDNATILSIHIAGIETVYFANYRTALTQHRRIMNTLLVCVRHYRGELFSRSGDGIAAAWNAFEARADHAQRAAACALTIARALLPRRQTGVRVGIVLHKGPFLCGIVQDKQEAFITAFGSTPRHALQLAELAASLPCFNVLVSESVKQDLSSLYECIMVDLIKYHEDDTPIIMFELGEKRKSSHVKDSPLDLTFAEEHARVFFQFRNHEFEEALTGVERLRKLFPGKGRKLVRRIELLCTYYMQHQNELPMPYFRPYPAWRNYEAIANVDAMPDLTTQGSKEDLLSETYRFHRPSRSLNEDEVLRFCKELHDNILASKQTQLTGTPCKAPAVGLLGGGNTEDSVVLASELDAEPKIKKMEHKTSSFRDVLSRDSSCSRSTKSIAENRGKENSLRKNEGEEKTEADNLNNDASDSEMEEKQRISNSNSVLSVQTPTNSNSEAKKRDGRHRFSLANHLLSAAIDRCGRSALRNDSIVSLISESAVHAHSMSFQGQDKSFANVTYELPIEFVAKNGITYLRSSRILGKGSFGFVYLGMDVLSGRMVAIKFLPLPSEDEEISNAETEVVTMQKVKSNHVVEFISYAFQNNLLIIVMECMMAGSLQGILTAFGSIPCPTVRLFIRDVLRGLQKLHSLGVIHRDVKPQNVLLTLAGSCKISDFGASAFLQELVRKQMEGKGLQVQGTPVYLAPEAARGTPEEKSDIWSCGIMFIQLVTGKLPYHERFLTMPPQILVFQIGSGAAQPIIPEGLDEFDVEFIRNCLEFNPNERFSAKKLLDLPMFSV